jgi:Fe-S oxidoreductase
MLSPEAKKGMQLDSLLVGFFILFLVGARFLSASFDIAKYKAAAFQPAAPVVSLLWSFFSEGRVFFYAPVAWWIALGLILGFFPYFPYSEPALLFLGPLNYLVPVLSNSVASVGSLSFAADSIERYGAGPLLHLPPSLLFDAYACLPCRRCQDACPACDAGLCVSPSAFVILWGSFFPPPLDAFVVGSLPVASFPALLLSADAAWGCAACGFCVEVCPVGYKPVVVVLRACPDPEGWRANSLRIQWRH